MQVFLKGFNVTYVGLSDIDRKTDSNESEGHYRAIAFRFRILVLPLIIIIKNPVKKYE